MRAEDKRIGVDHDALEGQQTRRQDRANAAETLLETGDDRGRDAIQLQRPQAERCAAIMAVLESLFRGEEPQTRIGPRESPIDGVTGLTPEEIEALRYIETAVRGREARHTHVVYAEDRRDLLEQALAVLYPTLSHALSPETALREQHDQLVEEVTVLRGRLSQLEDAQEDPVELRQRAIEEAKGDGDKDDDDDGGDGNGDGGDDDGDDEDKDKDDDGDRGEPPAGDVGDPGVTP